MSELITRLTIAASDHKSTDLGGLLQWAVLHIQDTDEALSEARKELEQEQAERIRMEEAIHKAREHMQALASELDYSRPVNIKLDKDHAPHINIMAHHGVEPYAKKRRKKS